MDNLPFPRRLAALALAAAALLRAQEPAPRPTPPPAEVPPVQEPTPPPERAAETPAAGEGTRGRGGRTRRGPGAQDQELPEFTPVAAPSLAALAGKQFFWFTMYPDFLVQYDPTTDAVVRKVKLGGGMFWSTTLTHDRKRMLVVTNQQQTIEVVDLAAATVVAEHPFVEPGFTLRVRDVRELPGGVHWFVRIDRVKKELDRYSFEPSQWLLYDSAARRVVRTMQKLPERLERGAEIATDGTHWLTQDDDGNLLFLDGRKLTETGRIDLRTPRHFGAGPLRLTGGDLYDRRDPTRACMLFTSTDPVEKRRTGWGVVALDLVDKRIVDVVEFGPQVSTWGLRIAHKKLVAAAMTGNFGGRGTDNRSRLLLIDLRTGATLAEAFEEFRPRRSLVAIAPEGDKIYIGTAGSDFEVFDAQLRRQKTVELEGEVVGRIHVVDG